MMRATMGFEAFGAGTLDIYVWLHTSDDPADEEWDSAVEQIRARIAAKSIRAEDTRWVVVSEGGAPNAKQRAQMRQLTAGEPYPTAVVTTALTNPLKRGVATALTWLNPKIAFFQPHEFDEALAHAGLTRERAHVWARLRALQSRMPSIRTLNQIAAATGLPLD